MATDSQNRVREAEAKLKEVKSFLDQLGNENLPTPKGLLKAYNLFLQAAERGVQIAKEAAEVEAALKAAYIEMVESLQQTRNEEEALVEEAEYARLWQARATEYVLSWQNDRSLVSRLTEKWKEELLSYFESEAKKKAAKQIWKMAEPRLRKLIEGGIPKKVGEKLSGELVDWVVGKWKERGKKPAPKELEQIELTAEEACKVQRRMARGASPFILEQFQREHPECFPR